MRYSLIISISFFAFAIPLTAIQAQQTEEHEVEKIEVPNTPDDSGKRPDLAAASKSIIEQTNTFRKKEGRGAVTTNAKLVSTAQGFADYMARTDEYGHHADGSNPGARVKKQGYEYCLVAENIAYAFNSQGFNTAPLANEFETGWEKSPPHRRNMLDPDVTETGVAVVRSEKTGYYYAVQLFGRPMSAAFVFKVENHSGQDVKYAIGKRTFDLPPRLIRAHTLCRPPEVKFNWPDGKSASLSPTSGERFLVTKDKTGFEVKKE